MNEVVRTILKMLVRLGLVKGVHQKSVHKTLVNGCLIDFEFVFFMGLCSKYDFVEPDE